MTEMMYCDHVINEKNLFAVPTFNPLMGKNFVESIERLIEQHKAGNLNPVLLKHEKDLPALEEFLQKVKQLPLLKRYSYLKTRYYGVFSQINFSRKTPEPLNRQRHPEVCEKQSQWFVDEATSMAEAYPQMEKLISKIEKWFLVEHNDRYQFSWGAVRSAVKIKEHLNAGTWVVEGGEEQLQQKAYQGLAVCVYYNATDQYYDGRGWVVSLSGAKMFESLEAAKRSIYASRWGYLKDFSFIQTGVIFTDVLETTGSRSPKLEAHVSRSIKSELEQQTLQYFQDQPEPSAPKRKM